MVSVEEKCSLNKDGTINVNSPNSIQSSRIISVKLHTYQLQTIFAMSRMETERLPLSSDESLTTEVGILSNKVGTGKSLCILGLIAMNPVLEMTPCVKGVYGDFAHVTRKRHSDVDEVEGKNLIVVPNHILKPVWESYLKEFTDLSFIIVRKNTFPIDWNELSKYEIILCNAKHYNTFIKSCPWYWSRIIFDEADSINIPACAAPKSRFVWFVTSSLNNLLFSNGYYLKLQETKVGRYITSGIPKYGYIKNTFRTMDTITDFKMLRAMIVKVNDDYIAEYLKLPKILHHTIICQSPYYIRAIHEHVSQSVRDSLHANDVNNAMEILGCAVDSKENLISFTTRNLKIQRKNLCSKLSYLQSMETFNDNSKHTRNSKLHQVSKDIDSIDSELIKIQIAISNIDHDDVCDMCPICLDEKKNKVMFVCCLNTFCERCVCDLLSYQTLTCPLCRNTLKKKNIIQEAKGSAVGYKNDLLINLILQNQQSRAKTVVFYKSEAGITDVFASCLNYKVLNGNNYSIMKTLDWFEKEDNNLLFVDVVLYACGLNLITATDLIFYQRMSNELENQLIGRAYRYGRNTSSLLHVHHLLHHEEVST